MTKKLNVDAITNELAESAFFRRPQREQPGIDKSIPQPEKQIIQENQSYQDISELVNARTPVRPNGKRIITRNSFEIYEDQMDSLRKISLQEKMEGKLGSMSQMVRDAIDAYLKEKTSSK
jgi:hypothetical protein